jgi:S1-C subfamily serine protease
MDKELNELLDRYAKKQLTAEEQNLLEEKAKQSEAFRQMVEDHIELVDSMVEYGQHAQLKRKLQSVHEEVAATEEPLQTKAIATKKVKINRFWTVSAVAASVALISVWGTVFVTNWYSTQRETQFKNLSRKVEQITRSQQILEKDLAASKKKPSPGNYAGTCFMISRDGYLVTSYHVVKDADSLKIENAKFGTLKATVLYHDPANDVSVLKVDTILTSLPFTIEKPEASLAEDVYTLGFPREDVVFGEGAISALSGYNQNPNSYQVSVPVNPGNSGGPLLNSRGNLIGMISGLQTETTGAAFAIKAGVLLDIVSGDSLKNTVSLPKQNGLKFSNRVAQVNSWKDYVFMVRVFKN